MNTVLIIVWLVMWCCILPSCSMSIMSALCPAYYQAITTLNINEFGVAAQTCTWQEIALGACNCLCCTGLMIFAFMASPDLFSSSPS